MSGAITFPPNPTTGQIFTAPDGTTWRWNGTAWVNANTGGNFTTVAQATTIATNISSANVGRNLLHNGLMTIWQRGTGPFNGVVANWTYTADRWRILIGGAGDTASVSEFAIGDTNRAIIGDEAAQLGLSVGVTGGSGATNRVIFAQPSEGVSRTSGKTVILSGWASSSVAGNRLGIAPVQNFGTGGSPSAPVPLPPQTVTLSTAIQHFALVFAVPSAAGKTFGTSGGDYFDIEVYLSAGANFAAASGIGVQSGGFYFWGVQLEIAQAGQTQPTPLEKLDPVLQLQQCQRFYQISNFHIAAWSGSTTGIVNGYLQSFNVAMRATPTLTPAWGTQSFAAGGLAPVDNFGCYSYVTGNTANAQMNVTGTFSASADL